MGRPDVTALRALVGDPDTTALRAYLTERSGLPGPRADLALVGAFADVAPADVVRALAHDPDEYLRCCGTVGLGRLLAEATADGPAASAPDGTASRPAAGPDLSAPDGDASSPHRAAPDEDELVDLLRERAADPLWRVREATAMALQRLGDARPADLRALVDAWATHPHPLVRRAAVAGVCEPRLLHDPDTAATALRACATTTASLTALPPSDRRDADVRTLRQALGYCWSVAVAAAPATGLPRWRALRTGTDPDVAWIVRENERKTRLARVLAAADADAR